MNNNWLLCYSVYWNSYLILNRKTYNKAVVHDERDRRFECAVPAGFKEIYMFVKP